MTISLYSVMTKQTRLDKAVKTFGLTDTIFLPSKIGLYSVLSVHARTFQKDLVIRTDIK